MDTNPEDNTRDLPAAAANADAGQAEQATSPQNSPDSPNNPSELVPIFFENEFLRAYDRGNLSQFTAAYDPSAANNAAEPFPFQFPLPQIGRITMADRFPSIEDLDLGEWTCQIAILLI
jgi:hypothetical protein